MSKKQFTKAERREHKAEVKSKKESEANIAPKEGKVEKSKSVSVKVRRFDNINDYDWAGTADEL